VLLWDIWVFGVPLGVLWGFGSAAQGFLPSGFLYNKNVVSLAAGERMTLRIAALAIAAVGMAQMW
jgi:hypothetical protein